MILIRRASAAIAKCSASNHKNGFEPTMENNLLRYLCGKMGWPGLNERNGDHSPSIFHLCLPLSPFCFPCFGYLPRTLWASDHLLEMRCYPDDEQNIEQGEPSHLNMSPGKKKSFFF